MKKHFSILGFALLCLFAAVSCTVKPNPAPESAPVQIRIDQGTGEGWAGIATFANVTPWCHVKLDAFNVPQLSCAAFVTDQNSKMILATGIEPGMVLEWVVTPSSALGSNCPADGLKFDCSVSTANVSVVLKVTKPATSENRSIDVNFSASTFVWFIDYFRTLSQWMPTVYPEHSTLSQYFRQTMGHAAEFAADKITFYPYPDANDPTWHTSFASLEIDEVSNQWMETEVDKVPGAVYMLHARSNTALGSSYAGAVLFYESSPIACVALQRRDSSASWNHLYTHPCFSYTGGNPRVRMEIRDNVVKLYFNDLNIPIFTYQDAAMPPQLAKGKLRISTSALRGGLPVTPVFRGFKAGSLP